MHWADKIADGIIAGSPDKEEYVCAAGISPSGSVHIGNFRDIVTSYFVCLALRKKGRNARLLFSWDEYDRFRKVPANVSEDFGYYIGRAYTDVPDPLECCDSYADHFEQEFEKALDTFGIEADFRYQTAEYRSGRYAGPIITAIEKRREIFDILDTFRTQDSTDEEREEYYPVSIYCPYCGRDNTKITRYNDDGHIAEYTCKCGHSGQFCFDTDFDCKLNWKIDWPMRWMAEGVDFEPGGKDHASPAGSYQTSKIIAEKIFGIKPPVFQGYEFIGIKGSAGKMSGSTGINLTPGELFKVYQPEIILWLYSKTDPMRAFDFCFDEGILRQYFEFDKSYTAYKEGKADELTADIIAYSLIPGREIKTVPMQQLVSFGSIVDFSPALLEAIFAKIGAAYTAADFEERVDLAKYWLENCSPESIDKLRDGFDSEYYSSLTTQEKQELVALREYIAQNEYTMDELQTFLYAVPSQVRGEIPDAKQLKQIQAAFFRNVYKMLIAKEKGPRLYLFLFALEKGQYLNLLPKEM
ncbi:MAG: lysine--tRNA ligase [Oscillospiraceae bacterium]|nr:lysine--tRNA ligase [Oscillospiraceae bacterium]